MDDIDKFEQELKTRFPEMLTESNIGLWVGKGWHHIVFRLCEYIQWHVKNHPNAAIQIKQIKEKFGGLRFYYTGGDDVIRGMVMMAEGWAITTCEVCGEPGTRRSGGWLKVLCDKHDKERKRHGQ
jgi:hypothetical protein